MASVTAGVLLAHVGDGGVGVRRLDLERGDQGVLGLDRHLVRLVADLDPDRVPQGHGAASPTGSLASEGSRVPDRGGTFFRPAASTSRADRPAGMAPVAHRTATMTWACMPLSTEPSPKCAVIARAASSVTPTSRPGARASISALS